MTTINTNDGVPRALRDLLTERMEAEGWDSIRSFQRGAKVPYSVETVRRAFSECDYKNLSPITLAVIMHRLNFSLAEIKSTLVKHIGRHPEVDLIGDHGSDISIQEQALVDAYRMMLEKEPELSNVLSGIFDVFGRITGTDVRSAVEALKKNGR